jgi:Tol biopolymer transport system component
VRRREVDRKKCRDEPAAKPHWFQDGRRLAYLSTRQSGLGIWSIDIGTRRDELLFDFARAQRAGNHDRFAGGVLGEIDLAPSMLRAAFSLVTPPAGRRVIFVSPMQPFVPRGVTDPDMSAGYPAWSPDEQRLAVEIKDGASTHAGIIDVESGALRRLTNERGQTWGRSWSPDGSKLAVAALRDGR